ERNAELRQRRAVIAVQKQKVGALEGIARIQHAAKEVVLPAGITSRLYPVSPKAVQQFEPYAVVIRSSNGNIVRQVRHAGPRLLVDQVRRFDVLPLADREFMRFEHVANGTKIRQ